MRYPDSRYEAVLRVRARLERYGLPRLQMTLIVILTGAAGFMFSAGLLHAGVTAMGWRYLVAFTLAYLVFLALLWLWMRTRAKDWCDPGLANADLVDSGSLPLPHSGTTSSSIHLPVQGEGGTFGGGGATGHFDAPIQPPSLDLPTSNADSGIVGDALGATADADELAIPLFILVLAAMLVFSAAFVIYEAPVLFAELIVDGALMAGLYRRLRGLEPRHWLEAALRHTWRPFLVTALVVAVAGWALQQSVPGAVSIGEVVFQAKHGKYSQPGTTDR